MSEIFLTTSNERKMRELREILMEIRPDLKLKSKEDFNIQSVLNKPQESGRTYFENALLKAKYYYEILSKDGIKIPVLSEDSGIEISALRMKPGIHSSRTPREDASDYERCTYILNLMSNEIDRKAKYVACVVIYYDNMWISAEGEVRGEITRELRGNNGFGYDPIFYSFELGKTFGESEIFEKNRVSHRARALTKIIPFFKFLKS